MCIIGEAETIVVRRGRNCAFSVKGKRGLDTIIVETDHGRETVVIPATVGTLYWAILKFMYSCANRPVYTEDYCKGVASLMEDRDPVKWEDYVRKGRVKTCKAGVTVEQKANNCNNRMVTNGRNLCRVGMASGNPYGKRLIDLGHVMRFRTDQDARGYFVLFTTLTADNMAEQKRGRKPRLVLAV